MCWISALRPPGSGRYDDHRLKLWEISQYYYLLGKLMLKTPVQRWDLITKPGWLLTDICFLGLINTTEKITRCKIFWHYDEWIFAPSQRWLWDIMYFLAQAMPIVPTAFYGLTLTSSGLNILNICHNYKLLPSTSTVFHFLVQF